MSNLSDFLVKPLPGVTKYDSNTLQLSAALAEIRAIATDTTGTGADAGVLRARNVRQANGAGPNLYLEGTNNAAAVKTIGRVQAAWLDVTAASEDSKLALGILAAGVATAVELRGDSTPTLAPGAAAGVALGNASLPWLEAWVGNSALTRSIKITPTGPATGNTIQTEGTSLAIYIATQPTLTVAAAGVTIGPVNVAGATAALGLQNTITTSGGHTGDITAYAATTTAQAGSGTVTGYLYTYNAATDYAFRVLAGSAGENLEYGVHIDTTVDVQQFAFYQKQYATPVGGFLQLENSAGTALFTVDVNGDLTLGSTGRRIKGDFSNATAANQVMFQSSTTNGATNIGAMPNGTGTSSGVTAYGGSDPANANYLAVAATSTGITVNSGKNGTGTTQAVAFQIDATTSLQIATNGDVVAGKAGLVVAATSGHLYIPAVAGVMTGVPTARAGFVPLVYDTTNNKFTVYNAAWKQSAALA